MLNASEADWYHLDVMDGRFVQYQLWFACNCQIERSQSKPFDVHLMIEEPGKYAADLPAGATILRYIMKPAHTCTAIFSKLKPGHEGGVAINPHTPVQVLQDILADVDIVLIMTVNPGFGGRILFPLINQNTSLTATYRPVKLNTIIEVDGGITANASVVVQAARTRGYRYYYF